MAIDPIKLIIEGVNKLDEPLKAIEKQAESARLAVQRISTTAQTISGGFNSAIQSSATFQLAIARLTPVADQLQQRFKLVGLEINNQLAQAQLRVTELGATIRDKLNNAYTGSFAQKIAQQIREAIPQAQQAADRLNQGIRERLGTAAEGLQKKVGAAYQGSALQKGANYFQQQGTVGNALLTDAQKVAGKLPAVFGAASARIPAVVGAALGRIPGIAGVAFTAAGATVGILQKAIGGVTQAIGAFGRQSEETHRRNQEGAARGQLGIAGMAGAYALAQGAVAAFRQVSARTYGLLIGQNIELREQVQSTAAQLASKMDVLSGGKVVSNTLEAIKAAQAPVQEQINKLRIDATRLSGVTSNDLVPNFQAMANAAGSLRLNLDQSREMATRLSAQAITLGLSTSQTQLYIQQIATGTIDPTYNMLAKSIGLNNERLRQLGSEGRLYEYIQQKTEAGLKGQELIAKSWRGVTSNIEEYIQLLGQSAGAPLLDALLAQFIKVEQFLKPDGPAFGGIKAFADTIGKQIADTATLIGDTVGAIASEFQKGFGSEGWAALQELLETVFGGFQGIFTLIKDNSGIFELLGQVMMASVDIFNEGVILLRQGFAALVSWIRDALVKVVELAEKLPGMGDKAKALKDALQSWENPVKGAAEAAKSLQDTTDTTLNSSESLLRKLNETGAKGTNLSKEQLANNEKLKTQAKEALTVLDEQIESWRKFAPFSTEDLQKKRQALSLLNQQKDAIQNSIKDLKSSGKEVTFQNKELENRGSIFKQMETKAKAFKQTLEKPLDLNQAMEAAKNLTDITKQQVEMGQISAQEAEKRLRAIANDGRLEIATRQAAAKEITAIRKAELDRQKADIQSHIAMTEAMVKSGKLGEVEGAEKVTELKKQELDIQLSDVQAQIQAEQKAIEAGNGNKNRLRELGSQQTELQAKQLQAAAEGEEKIQAARIAVFERAQKKALDVAKQAENDREVSIQRLLTTRQIRESRAEQLRLESRQKLSFAELELEQKRSAQLERLPKLSDPAKEAERQEKIRASRLKTGELTKQILEQEFQLQQAHYRVIEEQISRQLQAAKTAIELQTNPLQNQISLQEVLTKSLDNQNKIIEARKGLLESQSSYILGELNLLSQTARTEREKKQIAELSAAIKLKTLNQQQALEQQVLDLQLAQNRAALEKEKIQNRIAQLQNQAEVAQAQAELAKLKAKPDATPEEIAAAQLALKAKQAAGVGIELQGAMLNQQGQIDDSLASFKRAQLSNQQRLARDQAQFELIQTLPTGEKRIATEAFQRSLMEKFTGTTGPINQFEGTLNEITRAMLPGGDGNFALPGYLMPSSGNLALPQSSEVDRLAGSLKGFDYLSPDKANPYDRPGRAIRNPIPVPNPNQTAIVARASNVPATAILERVLKGDPTGGISQQNNISVSITGADLADGGLQKQVEQQILNGLYNVAQVAKQQKGKP